MYVCAHLCTHVSMYLCMCGFLPLQQLERLWTVRVENSIKIYNYNQNKHGYFLKNLKNLHQPGSPICSLMKPCSYLSYSTFPKK